MSGAAPELLAAPIQVWTDGTDVWLEIVSENGSNERVEVSLGDLERLQIEIADMIVHLKGREERAAYVAELSAKYDPHGILDRLERERGE